MSKYFSYKVIVGFVISIAMFMEAVDATVINTAIPVMAQSLSVNPIDLKIALISYLLSLAIFIPISGWLADKFGMKRVFVTALIIFTLSSVWCGFANNLYELVIARCLQGLGGSLTMPVGRLILLRTFPRHEMLLAMGRIVMVAALGLMLGPVVGGFITHYFSWRWVFWVNIPVGLFAILMSVFWIKTMEAKVVPPLDVLGFILFGSSLALFTFGLSSFSETAIPDAVAFLIMAISIILFLFYIMHSRKVSHPIVNTKLFALRTFRISMLGNLFLRLGFGGIPFLLPLLFQVGLNYPPQISGLLLAPMALGVLLVKPLSLPMLRFFGYKKLLIMNSILVACSLWALILINSQTSPYFIATLTFFYGFLMSLQYTGMNSIAYAEVSYDYFSSATSIMGTLQQLAQSFGVAMAALLVRIYSVGQGQRFVLTTDVFHHALFAMGVITMVSSIIFLRLKKEDGNEMLHAPAV